MNIKEFCEKHDACSDGYIRNEAFKDMNDFFKNSPHNADVIWAACEVLDEKDRMRFACWCVRQIWHLLEDDSIKNAIEVAEAYCRGEATKEELGSAVWDPLDAASYAASYAAGYAAWAASYAAGDAALANQVAYLRENFAPDWSA